MLYCLENRSQLQSYPFTQYLCWSTGNPPNIVPPQSQRTSLSQHGGSTPPPTPTRTALPPHPDQTYTTRNHKEKLSLLRIAHTQGQTNYTSDANCRRGYCYATALSVLMITPSFDIRLHCNLSSIPMSISYISHECRNVPLSINQWLISSPILKCFNGNPYDIPQCFFPIIYNLAK